MYVLLRNRYKFCILLTYFITLYIQNIFKFAHVLLRNWYSLFDLVFLNGCIIIGATNTRNIFFATVAKMQIRNP